VLNDRRDCAWGSGRSELVKPALRWQQYNSE
jgi:hypothetical protein